MTSRTKSRKHGGIAEERTRSILVSISAGIDELTVHELELVNLLVTRLRYGSWRHTAATPMAPEPVADGLLGVMLQLLRDKFKRERRHG